MKLALITPTFFPSETGYSFAFQGLCNSLLNHNEVAKITVFTEQLITPQKQFREDVDVKQLHFKGVDRIFSKFPKEIALLMTSLLYRDKLAKLYKELEEYDLILFETAERGWLSYLAYKNVQKPVVTRLHGAFPEAAIYFSKDVPYGKAYFDLLMETENIATTTYHYIDFIKKYLKDYTKLRNKKFFIIPNTFVDDTQELKKDNINVLADNGSIRLLQLGRMDERGYYYKGFNDTVQALLYLEKSNSKAAQRIDFTSIGSGVHLSNYLNSMSKLNFVNHTHHESLTNTLVKREIAEADVILMPSRNEGMSMFVVECIKQGKPFIFTDGENGLREVLVDGFNGIGVESFNYLQIKRALEYLEKNRGEINRMSDNSIQHYQDNYSNSSIAELFAVMTEMLSVTKSTN